MRNLFIPIAISVALLAVSAYGAPPKRVEIVYELQRNGTGIAEIVDRFEHDGRTYGIAERWTGRGLLALRGEVRRTSHGTIGPHGLRPLSYEDQRSGRDTERARLDWGAKQLTQQFKGPPETRPLPANAQDRLSFLYAFAFDPPGAQPVTVNVADGKGVSTYVFQVAGRERVRTPAGEFDALRLVKKKDGPQDRGTEIWLAASRGWLPVRVLVTDKDGTRLDQVATRIAAP